MKFTHVSVIMPIYNDDENLENAVKSILNQSHKNFELIIINDGSNLNTKNKILKFKKNKKIRIFHNNKNFGLAYSLNKAVKKSRYDIIARMDSDDFSFKNRLKNQLNFLKKNPQIDVLGTNALIIEKKKLKHSKVNERNNNIKKKIFFFNQFFHSSVIIKKNIFGKIGLYNTNFKKCQDYELWLRGRKKLYYSNMKKRLIKYNSKTGYSVSTLFYTILAILKNISSYRELIMAILGIFYNLLVFLKKNFLK